MKKQLVARLVTVVFVFQQCFLFLTPARSANIDIVINEIAAYESSGCEWVELYNKGAEAVNMQNWRFWENNTNHTLSISSSSAQQDWNIEPGEFVIVTQDDVRLFSTCNYVPPSGTIFDSSWTTLNEGGENIGLKDGENNLWEDMTYIASSHASLERLSVDSADTTSANWRERSSGNTFGRQNAPDTVSVGVGTSTSTARIVINEFVSNPNSGESEWLELYNLENVDVDLGGWTVVDGAGTTASVVGTISARGFLSVDMSSARFNNDGDLIALHSSGGGVVDTVSYGSWNDGNTNDNASAPARGNSVARRIDGANSGNNSQDFAESIQVTKTGANTIVSPPVSSVGGGGGEVLKPSASASSILINEFVSIPADDDEEFVELYNQTSFIIDLAGWTIEDGSEHPTVLSGSIAPHDFVVVRSPNGGLNNKGDTIAVFDPSGHEIDRVTYGVWDDAHNNTHVPAPSIGKAAARTISDHDTNNDFQDFVVTDTPTPGKANRIQVVAGTQPIGSHRVLINELLPNPRGVDTNNEWIELYNDDSAGVSIGGWTIRDDSGTAYVLPTAQLPAHGFLVVSRRDSRLALNNSGVETVELYDPQGTLADSVTYSGTVKEDNSYIRQGAVWVWSTTPTKGLSNTDTASNLPPVVQVDAPSQAGVNESIIFDTSDTIDPEGESLTWVWNFGDGATSSISSPTHAFTRSGVYAVTVVVTDAHQNSTQNIVQVHVGIDSSVQNVSKTAQVHISEIFPNPKGSDDAEFIELVTDNNESADISGWKLDDGDGGSRPYIFSPGTLLVAGERKVFGHNQTKLVLNNTHDTVRLYDTVGNMRDEVAYDGAKEGRSYTLNNQGAWLWTDQPTPGEAAVVSVGNAAALGKVSGTRVATTLDQALSLKSGQKASIEGVVAVLPGVYGTQYFYVTDPDSGAGLQIYMNKKNFPLIKIGDLVHSTGIMGTGPQGPRLKVTATSDIKVLAHDVDIVPTKQTISDIDEQMVGQLIQISGEITDIKTSYLYLDDGTGEFKIYKKTGAHITFDRFHQGDNITVTGILGKSASEIQLWPRGQKDMSTLDASDEVVDTATASSTFFAGAGSVAYVKATAGGMAAVVTGLALRSRVGGRMSHIRLRLSSVLVRWRRVIGL